MSKRVRHYRLRIKVKDNTMCFYILHDHYVYTSSIHTGMFLLFFYWGEGIIWYKAHIWVVMIPNFVNLVI